jgi:hypothetical protein
MTQCDVAEQHRTSALIGHRSPGCNWGLLSVRTAVVQTMDLL